MYTLGKYAYMFSTRNFLCLLEYQLFIITRAPFLSYIV